MACGHHNSALKKMTLISVVILVWDALKYPNSIIRQMELPKNNLKESKLSSLKSELMEKKY